MVRTIRPLTTFAFALIVSFAPAPASHAATVELVDVTLKSGRTVTGQLVEDASSTDHVVLRFQGEVTTLTRRLHRHDVVKVQPVAGSTAAGASVANVLAAFGAANMAELADIALFGRHVGILRVRPAR